MIGLFLVSLQLISTLTTASPPRGDVVAANLAAIERWNAEGGAVFARNEFVVYTPTELKEMLREHEVVLPEGRERMAVDQGVNGVAQGPPAQFDWREFGAVSPPRELPANAQAVAAGVSTVESAYFRLAGELVEFSDLEIAQCYSGLKNLTAAFDYIASARRLASLGGYGAPAACATDTTANAMTAGLVSRYSLLVADDYTLINSMMRYPLLATVTVNDRWYFYASGVLSSAQCPSSGSPNHMVSLVGYCKGSYILKNTWGPAWGEAGYIRLERGEGLNTCGILNNMVEPEIEREE